MYYLRENELCPLSSKERTAMINSDTQNVSRIIQKVIDLVDNAILKHGSSRPFYRPPKKRGNHRKKRQTGYSICIVGMSSNPQEEDQVQFIPIDLQHYSKNRYILRFK
jgi:hypothetical protein